MVFRILYNIWAVSLFGFFVLLALPWAYITRLFGEQRGLRYLLRSCQWGVKTWARLVGVKLVVEGSELLDSQKQYVFVANHTANADTIIMTAAVDHIFTALGKKEVQYMPILGYFFRRVCVLVDRKDPKDRRRSVEELKKRAASGLSVLLFPEGTFPDKPQTPLLPFYSGAFRVAIELQLPIVPMVLIGARNLLTEDKLPIRPCTITCRYTSPIDTVGLGEEDIDILKEQVFRRIEALVIEEEPMFAHFKEAKKQDIKTPQLDQ